MSGEMNTSLGNTFTNFAVSFFLHCTKGGDPSKFDGVFEGDDALVCTDIDLTPQDFAQLGFVVKLKDVDPLTASFCGQIFSTAGQTIRDPLKFLVGFGWTHSKIHAGDEVLKQLLKAKCLSCLYENHDCPIVSHVAWSCLQWCGDVAPEFVADGYHDYSKVPLHQVPPNILPETRQLFNSIYGFNAETQIEIENLAMKGDFDTISDILEPHYRKPDHGLDVLEYAAHYVEAR